MCYWWVNIDSCNGWIGAKPLPEPMVTQITDAYMHYLSRWVMLSFPWPRWQGRCRWQLWEHFHERKPLSFGKSSVAYLSMRPRWLIIHHRLRYWLGAELVTRHYLNQWWQFLDAYMCHLAKWSLLAKTAQTSSLNGLQTNPVTYIISVAVFFIEFDIQQSDQFI